MEYLDICKYVFSEEVVDWELHTLESRKRQLVLARQISIYLGNWFYPTITDRELAAVFNKDHATASHAIKTIKQLLFSDKALRLRMDKYLRIVREKIKADQQKEVLKAAREKSIREKLLETIDSMELIAKVYCDITGKELTNKL